MLIHYTPNDAGLAFSSCDPAGSSIVEGAGIDLDLLKGMLGVGEAAPAGASTAGAAMAAVVVAFAAMLF